MNNRIAIRSKAALSQAVTRFCWVALIAATTWGCDDSTPTNETAQPATGAGKSGAKASGESGGKGGSTVKKPAGSEAGAGGASGSGGAGGSGDASACSGKKSDAMVCKGKVLYTCDGKDGYSDSETCDSATLCEAGALGTRCGKCEPDELSCEGKKLQKCDKTGQFAPHETLDSADECKKKLKESGGGCEKGEFRCVGDVVNICNSDQTGFEKDTSIKDPCGKGLCNEELGKCNACEPDSVKCNEKGNGIITCSKDGQTTDETACDESKPVCDKDKPECRECKADSECPDDGKDGVPICGSEGVCSTGCRMSGTYAIKLTATVKFGEGKYIKSGSGQYILWVKLEGTQTGEKFTGKVMDCGGDGPRGQSKTVNESYDLDFPVTSFGDKIKVESDVVATVSGSSTDAKFDLPPAAVLRGATMGDPVNDPWPTSRSELTESDMDGDGNPGITGIYGLDNGDTYARVDETVSGIARAQSAYAAVRSVFSLGGNLINCKQSTGIAEIKRMNMRIFGCKLTTGRNCTDAQTELLDTGGGCPEFSPATGNYKLLKIADNATCADVRSAVP